MSSVKKLKFQYKLGWYIISACYNQILLGLPFQIQSFTTNSTVIFYVFRLQCIPFKSFIHSRSLKVDWVKYGFCFGFKKILSLLFRVFFIYNTLLSFLKDAFIYNLWVINLQHFISSLGFTMKAKSFFSNFQPTHQCPSYVFKGPCKTPWKKNYIKNLVSISFWKK